MAHNNKGKGNKKDSAPVNADAFKLDKPDNISGKAIDVVVNGFISGTKRPKKVLGLKDIGYDIVVSGVYMDATVHNGQITVNGNSIKVDKVYLYVDKRQHISMDAKGHLHIWAVGNRPLIIAKKDKKVIGLFIQRNDMQNIVSNVIGDIVADN